MTTICLCCCREYNIPGALLFVPTVEQPNILIKEHICPLCSDKVREEFREEFDDIQIDYLESVFYTTPTDNKLVRLYYIRNEVALKFKHRYK